jgi:hypothetical protein
MNIWEQSFEDLRRPHLEEKKGDGNLANNYPPYDKVTRGDIIAGALGKDQMGGKKKKMKNEERKLGGGMNPGGGYDRGYKAMQKEIEKLDKGEEPATAKRYKEMRKEHSDWRSDLGFFTEEDCGCDGPIKPKKGIKNKVTINPDLKTEQSAVNAGPSTPVKNYDGKILQNFGATRIGAVRPKPVKENQQLQEKPGDGYIGPTPIPNPIRLAKDVVDATNRATQKRVDAVNAVLPGSASMPKNVTYFNKGPSDASKRYLGLQNSYEPEGEQLDEVTPPGAKYERMVKHIKKGYSDGGLSKKEKSIAYATAWKQYNEAKNEEFEIEEGKQTFPYKKVAAKIKDKLGKSVYAKTDNSPVPNTTDAEKRATTQMSKMARVYNQTKRADQEKAKANRSSTFYRDTHPASAPKMKKKNEEFAGNYEGPLYAPHPDIEEAYQPIDKDKENRMYRRAGNLARTALSSRGKAKENAQTKSSKIVSAITRQKETERFYRIGQHPKHNEQLENELDYYLGEALRPASERMKRVQTDAGRKKQEKERERKSKLEAEADKILAGFSKKGTGLAKTKPMSERREMDEPGERDTNPDVKRHNKMVGYRPRPKRPSIANDPRYGTVQDRSGKFKY